MRRCTAPGRWRPSRSRDMPLPCEMTGLTAAKRSYDLSNIYHTTGMRIRITVIPGSYATDGVADATKRKYSELGAALRPQAGRQTAAFDFDLSNPQYLQAAKPERQRR